jgi:hypothetical protein
LLHNLGIDTLRIKDYFFINYLMALPDLCVMMLAYLEGNRRPARICGGVTARQDVRIQSAPLPPATFQAHSVQQLYAQHLFKRRIT